MSPVLLITLPILLPLLGAPLAIFLRRNHRLQSYFALGVSSLALLVSLWLAWNLRSAPGGLAVQLGSWPAPFGISLVADPVSVFFLLMVQFVMWSGFVYSLGSKEYSASYPTYYPFFLMLSASLSGAFLTGDLFNLFVFAELVVISGTVLTAISDDRFGVEAAYKYFYISLLASVTLLLAVGSLYIAYGTLNMADLARRISESPDNPYASLAMIFLLAAFMVNGAVIPFHFWQPDFHTAAPTPVSAMLSSIVVKLGVYGFLRMSTLLFMEAEALAVLRGVLIVVGVAGVVLGGLAAIGTYNAKRMLAYSTLAQIGFILVGIAWGTEVSLAAALIFSFNHSLIKSAMLMIAGNLSSRAPVKGAAFTNLTGLGRQLPAAGVLFFLGSMALAGLPPLNGFISKFWLFKGGVEADHLWILGLIGFSGLLTLIYTLRAFQKIWWQADESERQVKKGDSLLAPALLISLCILFGLWPERLVELAHAAASWMIDPAQYIALVLGG